MASIGRQQGWEDVTTNQRSTGLNILATFARKDSRVEKDISNMDQGFRMYQYL